jgi:exodeoxyribonuclease-3
LRWLDESRPDVACLQELKSPQERFPEAAVRDLGYGMIWHGQKSWNGVAILARGADPIERRRVLPGDPDDVHSRYIEATVGSGAAEIVVGCLYLPNGNPAPGLKFEYKLRWLERFLLHSADLVAEGAPVVLAGDYNIIPTAIDVYKPDAGWTTRFFGPKCARPLRGFWHKDGRMPCARSSPTRLSIRSGTYFRNAYARNAGLRIDHLLLSPALAGRLTDAGVDRDVRGRDKPSDHAPVWIKLSGSG